MLKDSEFRQQLVYRKNFLLAIISILGIVLIVNLYILQIKNAKKYQLLSDKNRIRVQPIIPRRGRIISSDGKILAYCNNKYKLVMDHCSKKVFDENIKLLNEYLKFSDEDKERLIQQRDKRSININIKDDLSLDEAARVSMNLFKLNGVYLLNTFARTYYMPMEFSHLIGYTAKINSEFQILEGKTGLESFFDEKLRGVPGNVQKEINAMGRNVRVIDTEDPINGEDITLTVNSEIQKFVYDQLSEHKVGACCVSDMDGNIIALVSFPGYDINAMSLGISQAKWNELNNNIYKPLLNRFSSAVYPPGSIFKIVTAYAALKEKIVSADEKIICLGGVKQDNHMFHCWNRGGHGQLNIKGALSQSCDCYFFEVARKLGIQKLAEYARELGFGEEVGIEIPNERKGLVPDKEWKFLRFGRYWQTYETMLAGIGQGAVLTSILQVSAMMGKMYINNRNYSLTLISNNKKEKKSECLDKRILDIVKKGLYQVCNIGTARRSCKAPYGISGKTGSSQVRKIKSGEVGIKQNLIDWKYRDHAFFTGVAPYDNPKYIVSVFVEHGGGGASVAAPIARKIFDKLIVETNEVTE